MFASQRLRMSPPPIVYPTVSVVQSTGNDFGSSTISFTNPVASGNSVILVVQTIATWAPTVPLAGCGLTFTQVGAGNGGAVYYCTNPNGLTGIITAANNDVWAMAAIEVHGAVGSPAVTSGSGGTLTVTPTRSGQLVAVGLGSEVIGTSPTSPWNIANSANRIQIAYQVVSSTTSVTATWTSSGPHNAPWGTVLN